MRNLPKNSENVYLGVLSLIAWFAIVFQFYLHIRSGIAPKTELFIRFFSYFTIESNLMVALWSTFILFFPKGPLGTFFSRATVKTAVTVYIAVVALVYNTVLRFLWTFKGWPAILNELLHVVVPLLCVFYWIYFVPKDRLKWNSFWVWLLYPLFYSIFVLVRGNYTGFYPYPFLNVGQLGMQKVMLNCAMVTLVFMMLSIAFIAIGKRQSRNARLEN